jgi:hypothetical protein
MQKALSQSKIASNYRQSETHANGTKTVFRVYNNQQQNHRDSDEINGINGIVTEDSHANTCVGAFRK